MSKATLNSRITAGLLCIFLAACGGGGGETAPLTAAPADTGGSAGAPVPSGAQSNTPVPSTSGDSPSQGGTSPTDGGTAPTDTAGPQADATLARFHQPIGIAVDASGNLYVADSMNYTIRKIAPSGVVTTLAGSAGISGSADGVGAQARFSFLKGLAVDGAANVYAVDDNAIRKITPAGVVTTLAGAQGVVGDADGPGATARFARPWGVAVDAAGNVYVADTENYLVRKISPAGIVSTHAGTRGMRGTANGSLATATFLGPVGIAINTGGNIYVTDWFGPPAPNIPEGSTFIRRLAADGAVSTMAGNLNSENGPAAFMDSFALTADAAGNVYVASLRNVRRVSASGTISTLAGPTDQFQSLKGIAIDATGTLFVTDESNHTVSSVSQAGTIALVAGKPGESGSADGP